jgi:hypothetical protein
MYHTAEELQKWMDQFFLHRFNMPRRPVYTFVGGNAAGTWYNLSETPRTNIPKGKVNIDLSPNEYTEIDHTLAAIQDFNP